MLSDSVTTTPRPLPPAKARRLTSIQYARMAPPPPYESSLEMGSPLSATAQIVGSVTSPEGLRAPLPSPSMEDWMNEKSREELSGLLLKADELIKSRETELSLTSALCKTLYHDNVALKNKHETLLSRLPSTRASTPASSAPTSPVISSTPTAKSPLSYDDKHNLSPEYDSPLTTAPALDHLADQNAELLDKLEKLEAEAQLADQAGKRKLRRLETEIQALHEELESTQAKEAELEQQTKAVLNTDPSEVQRRKEEREERVRVFKEKSATLSGSEEVRDFAPPPELPRVGSLNVSSSTATQEDVPPSHPSPPPEALPTSLKADAENNFSPSVLSPRVRLMSNSPAEFAIISQLLVKVQELEEMNAQMKHEQNLTEERLRSAQWDAESIRRVYDCLGDGADVELQVVPEDFPSPLKGKSASNGTLRFSSLRKSIILDISRDSGFESEVNDESDVFGAGIILQSTTRSVITPGGSSRKSVVGLFDPEPASASLSLDTPDMPPLALMTPSPLGAPSELGDISIWSTEATDGLNPPSPELGSEFGDDWGANAGNHHLRASSLYNLTGLNLSREASASPVVSPSETPAFVFPSLDSLGAESSTAAESEWGAAGPSTPPPLRGLQLTVEAPTPTQVKASRSQRLSQTMRARTHRWVERRYGTAPLSEPAQVLRRRRALAVRGSMDASMSMSETFDDVLQTFSRVGSMGAIAPLADADAEPGLGADSDADADHAALEVHAMARVETSVVLDTSGVRRDGFVGFMLEVWLWLQFAIVVLVFLWTMAKRGPKSVLEDAERRRVQQGA
ncbi:hypothetical protein B0H21DRAFT_717203 [Amylocystis lapponica]|nr:hypothetical protein B0H21DRAFT_717203 [Amylocystis lapponica]